MTPTRACPHTDPRDGAGCQFGDSCLCRDPYALPPHADELKAALAMLGRVGHAALLALVAGFVVFVVFGSKP